MVTKAYQIAKKNLIDCCYDLGIICGLHHFTDLWARDSFFASFGANLIGQKKSTEKTIETFISFQKQSGLIPYRIQRSPTTISKYFGQPRYFNKPRPNFRSRQSGGLVLDGGLMLIIAFWEYIKMHKNMKFLNKHYLSLEKCLNWYIAKYKNSLLSEWFMCDWQDSVLKAGKTLYTNILYWKALSDFSQLSALANKSDSQYFSNQALAIKAKIMAAFWNGEFLIDWIDYKKHQIFNSLANLLAVWWDFTDKKQSKAILNYARKYCFHGFTLEENHPRYPFWRIPFWNHLAGMSDYHNRGCLWLQPGILYSLCLNKLAEKQQAREMISEISKTIVKFNGVYEIYEKNGRPVKRLLYQAEFPFAWSSGLYIYAFYNIIKK